MTINAPKKLIPAFDNLKSCLYDIIIMEGGRGGAKSEALSALGVLESFIDDGVILCCREIQKSIADSLYATIVSTIYKYELQSYFKIIQGEITNNLTGARFIFAGLKSNITSIKSINKLRVVLVDEAENVTDNSWSYLRPTPRYGQVRFYVVFNPRFEQDATWQQFIVNKDNRTLHINISYKDNPWFPEALERQRQRDLRGDAGRYAWIWEGKFLQISDSSILAKKLKVLDFEITKEFGTPYIGIDWGFSVDPTAIIEAYVYEDALYITNAASKVGLELDDTGQYLIDHVPNVVRYTSRADCARPETISKVKKEIPLIKGCTKWKGSVEDGVVALQTFKAIYIHPEAEHCYAELAAYSYKLDKDGNPTTDIQDTDNHYADALRYAIEPLIQHKPSIRVRRL
jgi:phage terminase large subunit